MRVIEKNLSCKLTLVDTLKVDVLFTNKEGHKSLQN